MRRHLLVMTFALSSACGPANGEWVEPEACAETTLAAPWQEGLGEAPDATRFAFEVAGEDSLAFVSEPAVSEDGALALTVRGGEVTNGGNRAEISANDSDPVCQEAWTSWRFMIPADFQDAAPEDLRWQVIAQWHDQPDTSRGESWEGYPNNSPMISLNYGVYDAIYDSELSAAGLPDTLTPGDPFVVMNYGVAGDLSPVGAAAITKGEWHEVVAHTSFALDASGFAGVWIDGEPLPHGGGGYARGRNMYNRAPAYLKLGIYRNPEIRTTNSIHLDEWRRAGSREEL